MIETKSVEVLATIVELGNQLNLLNDTIIHSVKLLTGSLWAIMIVYLLLGNRS